MKKSQKVYMSILYENLGIPVANPNHEKTLTMKNITEFAEFLPNPWSASFLQNDRWSLTTYGLHQ